MRVNNFSHNHFRDEVHEIKYFYKIKLSNNFRLNNTFHSCIILVTSSNNVNLISQLLL